MNGKQSKPAATDLGLEIAILHLLAVMSSREQPMPLQELCEILALYRVQEDSLQARIQSMQRRGYPLGSAQGGLYLVRIPQESGLHSATSENPQSYPAEIGSLETWSAWNGEISEQEIDEMCADVEQIIREKEAS